MFPQLKFDRRVIRLLSGCAGFIISLLYLMVTSIYTLESGDVTMRVGVLTTSINEHSFGPSLNSLADAITYINVAPTTEWLLIPQPVEVSLGLAVNLAFVMFLINILILAHVCILTFIGTASVARQSYTTLLVLNSVLTYFLLVEVENAVSKSTKDYGHGASIQTASTGYTLWFAAIACIFQLWAEVIVNIQI